MFLLRTIFWLVVLVLLLPTNAQQQSQVYGTAQAAVKDVSGFCERNPTVCSTGKDAFDVFVHKARFGAEMLMSFVKGRTGFGGGDAATAADPNAADTAADPTATETPGDYDSAAPAEDFGKQSSLDQAGIAQASIDFMERGACHRRAGKRRNRQLAKYVEPGRPASGLGRFGRSRDVGSSPKFRQATDLPRARAKGGPALFPPDARAPASPTSRIALQINLY